MLLRTVACLLLIGWSTRPAAADWLGLWSPSPITAVQQVRKLTPNEVQAAWPVKLTGIVSHINPHCKDFFLQDSTAGIYVHPTTLASGLKCGDLIELDGMADPGAFAPCVIAKRVTHLGQGKLPDPLPYDLTPGDSRWLDGQWVQVWAVVRGLRTDGCYTRIDIYNMHGVAAVMIPGEQWANDWRHLKDLAVKIRGVCVPTFSDRLISGPPKIYVADLQQIAVLPVAPSAVPEAKPRLIDYLLRFNPVPLLGACPGKFFGVVTARPFPGMMVIQDDTYGATVWSAPTHQEIPVGSRIVAEGLVRIEGQRLSLTHAKVTVLGKAPLPPAFPTCGSELSAGFPDYRLVRLEARVEATRRLPGWTAFLLVEGTVRFEVYVPDRADENRLDQLELGSRVAVTGVPFDVAPDGKAMAGQNLFLCDPAALTLLETPPPAPRPTWWTATRVGYLTGGFLAVTVLGSGWLFVLRLQVRKASRQIQQQYEEQAKLENQLRHAAKLEAVGRLAGGIAHDFNNLLTVINGCAEMLVDEASVSGERVSELADDIRQAGERAAALTGQLLTFSRKREVQVSAVNINDVVTETVRLLDRVIGENIRIHTQFASDLPPICGEPGLLHQVVMNLAVNAKDAMPGGGTLTLITAQIAEPIPPAKHPQGKAGSFRTFVRLTVADTGTGMTDEVKSRIFEPFFTTKEVGTGTGLGLATVYGIVKTIRGKIQVDSHVGQGTTFHIDLRLHGDPGSDSDLVVAAAAPLPPRRKLGRTKLTGATILVVEDNAMVRDLIVGSLTTDGATVLAADTPTQALRVLADYPNRVDVMITDVVMPGMSGRKLADKVRADRPTVRIVYMSGYTADEVLREGVLADQVEFLQKPFTPDHLTKRLIGVLGRVES